MHIGDLNAGMILDSIYNSCLKKDSEYRSSKFLKYVGKTLVIYSHKEGGKELCANVDDVMTWCGYKIR